MRRLPFLLAFAAAALAVLFWQAAGPLPSTPSGSAGGSDEPQASASAAAADASDPRAAAERKERSADARREELPTVAPMILRIRLVGTVASAPWTAPLALHWEGRDESAAEWLGHEERIEVAPDGTAACALPSFVATTARQQWRLRARDEHHEPLDWRCEGAVDLRRELELRVQPVAVLTGRVVDARGVGVAAATVAAFGTSGVPGGSLVGRTNTHQDGTYRLRVPSAIALTVIATAMEPMQISGRTTVTEDGIATGDRARRELQPAACRTTGALGSPTGLPDLVLRDARWLTGVVRWPDGTGIAGAQIAAVVEHGEAFPVAERAIVRRSPDGTAWLAAGATTQGDGSFALPAQGEACRLLVVEIPGCLVWADLIADAAPAPSHTVITVPAPVTLRATHAGAPAAGATLGFDHGMQCRADDAGRLRVLAHGPLEVQASAGRGVSAKVRFDVADRGRTIELQMVDVRTRIAIEFEGDVRMRSAAFAWHGENGSSGRQTLVRDDRGGPFELFLEPGRHRLRAGPVLGDSDGMFLQPIERDLAVGTIDLELTLPATFGGQLIVHATDPAGRHVAAHCRVRDAQGRDRTASFVADGRVGPPGELHDSGPCTLGAVLEPGDYELELTTAAGAVLRQRIAIEARQTAIVRFSVP